MVIICGVLTRSLNLYYLPGHVYCTFILTNEHFHVFNVLLGWTGWSKLLFRCLWASHCFQCFTLDEWMNSIRDRTLQSFHIYWDEWMTWAIIFDFHEHFFVIKKMQDMIWMTSIIHPNNWWIVMFLCTSYLGMLSNVL